MLSPPRPYNERQRLETLRSLKILNTNPEERFDRFTRLAARLFDVPISLVSLVDANRQWFKSRHGLEVCETSREVSFCGHAILGDNVMVVEDALKDQRFADNPLVTGEPGIRFYAGYPLASPDGHNVGTLCIIDRAPREMSADEIGLLTELGRAIEQEMVAMSCTTIDDTTGLSNLSGFEAMGGQVLAVCRRLKRPATFLYMNLNNAQQLVASGDATSFRGVLVEFAQMLLVAYRDSDVLGRIGEHEFGVILAGTTQKDAVQPVRRTEELVREFNLRGDKSLMLEFDLAAIPYDPETEPSVPDLVRAAVRKIADARDALQKAV